ncbi:hypothetical protein BJV74DRAFT_883497 [Russula compacta]|nr:hypothetical protein BJV74DRAFT_883497 [Russula compacta]
MNVRKLIESYEQEKSSTAARPPTRTGSLRPYPRARLGTVGPGISLVPAKQRSLRMPRTSSLKIVKEERPVTIMLNECTNGLQIERKRNAPCLSVPLRSDIGAIYGQPSITSAELLCTLATPPSQSFGKSPVLSSPVPSSTVSARLALQKRATLRARRQQRYSREEFALVAALRRPAEYEGSFSSRPSMQYAIKQLSLRLSDAKTRLAELRQLLQDDTTDQVTHQALLRTRWMLERWIASAEKDLPHAGTSTGRPAPSDAVIPSTRKTRKDANLAYFFSHSPTRTTTSLIQPRFSRSIQQTRMISKHNVEPPQLRKWPLTTTLRAPMKLKPFPSTPHVTNCELSLVSLTPQRPPSPPEPTYFRKIDVDSLVTEPSSTPQGIYTAPTFPNVPVTPLDDTQARTQPGFAVIYVPAQPSDEELLAALSADMEAEPMPEYVSYLLNQLEPIGHGVVLPGLSRKGTTTTSGFELISRPSIEAYEYPVLPRSRLFVRRNMRVPPARTRLSILSGLCALREDPSLSVFPRSPAAQDQASPRSGLFSKMRQSMIARGHQ